MASPLKLVRSGGKSIPVVGTANDDSKMEYFAMRMVDDKPTETYGPFPSSRAAEDAIAEWYAEGEWYIASKVKVIHKKESSNARH